MLKRLCIKNFALIRELDLDFQRGFHSVTGETGAGKSMLLGAVAAALGSRVHREMLHAGHLTQIECVFIADAVQPPADLCITKGEDVHVQREINATGRSRYTINGQSVTQKQLRALAPQLVDFHGQRDLARLMDRLQHATLFDALPAVVPARERHDEHWRAWQELDEQTRNLEQSVLREREMRELWTFQSGELASLDASPGEDEELAREHALLANAEEIKSLCYSLADQLFESDENLHGLLAEARQRLEQQLRHDDALREPARMLDEALLAIQEAATGLGARAEQVDWDPERLAIVRERMELLHRMIRKYGGSLDSLLARQQEIEAALASGTRLEEELARCRQKRDEALNLLQTSREHLGQVRAEHATLLAASLLPLLEELGIQGGRFEVVLEETSGLDPIGAERPCFYISTNPDTPMGPLEQIASGGELSRVMLALKVLLLSDRRDHCLIFDEIDAGLSGRAALATAGLLRRLAQNHQLICITHLPQIAAAASIHLEVEKISQSSGTSVLVNELDENGRQQAIARLQSGAGGEQELAAAAGLLRHLHQDKDSRSDT